MENKSWVFVEKADWGDGPWQHEPDKAQWQDPATGLPCILRRGPVGAWCGYVGVTPGHPAYERSFGDVDADVHGGLTYSDHCQQDEGDTGICHLPEPGEPDNVWWLGFDCAHAFDYAPQQSATMRQIAPDLERERERLDFREVYRDFDYAKLEVERLAAQLAGLIL